MLASSLGVSQLRHMEEPGDIAIVVNESNPVNELTLSELRNMLMGDRRFWKGNVRVKLILREPGSYERDGVLNTLLKIDNKLFAAHWRAKIFRGEASEEPSSVQSDAQVENYLSQSPGGLAFMRNRSRAAHVKVLRLDGKLPGDDGYVLK